MLSPHSFYRFVIAVCLATLSFLTPAALAAPAPLYESFTVPHSTGTYPLSINKDLTITGYYLDEAGKTRGFVRTVFGKITTFGVPGSVLTKPVAINSEGEITGFYEVESDGYPVTLGFIRHCDGQITTFGADSYSDDFEAKPVAINDRGEIVGNYPSAGGGSIGFLRSATGEVQSGNINEGAAYSTFFTAINAAGSVVGYGGSDYLDMARGLLWDGKPPAPNFYGGYTPILYPGADGTFPTGINKKGEIVGCYNAGGVYSDFIRATDGTFTAITPPGTVPSCLATPSSEVTYNLLPATVSLNNEGTVIGYTTKAGVTSGFVRFPGGKIVPFEIPGSILTIPTGVDSWGVLTGYYTKDSTTKGFIALP
jgi:hypothetical protein